MVRKLLSLVRRPSPGTVLGGLALIVALSGVAVAAIPSGDGTVTACISKGGRIKVIDVELGKTCSGRQTTVRLAAADPSGKVAHADLLDGKDSTEFLEATAKAGDADLLDGIDSTALGGFLTGRINRLPADGLSFGSPSGTSPALPPLIGVSSAAAAAAHLSPNVDLQARDLTVRLSPPDQVPNAGSSTFTLWVDEVPTSLVCTMTGFVDQTCSATGPPVPIAAGSRLSIGVNTSDMPETADALFSLRLTPSNE